MQNQHAEQYNRFRGNIALPSLSIIPSQHFENPSKLILYLYKKPFFEHILNSTNNRIKEKVQNPDNRLVSIEELFEYQALNHLATSSFLKPAHMSIEKWFKNVNYLAKPLIGENVDLDLKMSYERFNFISKYIDTGEKVLVDKMVKGPGNRLVKCTRPNSSEPIKIYDMNKKVDGLINNLNGVVLRFKNPDDRFLTLDESFRKSFSKMDRMRTFMPGKPDKYGHKYQSLVDSDTYVHFFQFEHSAQFSNWTGTSDLLEYMIPDQYRNRGITLCCDNFYFTFDNLKLLHSHGISAFGTFRKNRMGKVMGHSLVNTLTKKMKKREFQRKIDIFECRLNPNLYGQDQFIQFCFFWDRLDKVILFGLNDPRLFNTDDGSHKSKILVGSEKPNIVLCYNEKKAFVDEVDRMMTQYTSVRPYRNGRCIRRFICNCWDFALNNAYILFRNHYKHTSNQNSKYAKLLKNRKLRTAFYYELLFGLIGFKRVVPDMEPNVPFCGPFKVRYCDFRPHDKRTRTQFICAKCSKNVCKSHSVPICHDCYCKSNFT